MIIDNACSSIVPHHSAIGSGPLSSPNHSKRAVSQPLEQLKLRLSDQAGERSSRITAGWGRTGRRPLGKGLLGVGVGSFHRKHLQTNKGMKEKYVFSLRTHTLNNQPIN